MTILIITYFINVILMTIFLKTRYPNNWDKDWVIFIFLILVWMLPVGVFIASKIADFARTLAPYNR